MAKGKDTKKKTVPRWMKKKGGGVRIPQLLRLGQKTIGPRKGSRRPGTPGKKLSAMTPPKREGRCSRQRTSVPPTKRGRTRR